MFVAPSLIVALALVAGAEVRGPLSPDEARKAFHIAPGLRVELVASEPDLESPVAMAFDVDGRLWVVEMRDYPNGPTKGQPPEGRLRILEDRDATGRYRHAAFFAEGLLFANGVLPWRGGAIVTCAPHILYLKDGHREVLYEGFAAENPQLRVSHPVLGLDNWVYVANGLRGGQVKRTGRPDVAPINLSGMDFRFDLLHDQFEAVTGMGQYGNTFDDWGHRFVCTNRNHLTPIVLPNRYVHRNPFLAVPEPARDDQRPGGSARVYPLSKNWTTSAFHAGTFTAACGVTIYRGNLLPQPFRGSAFTCEPTGNLVHQEVLTPHGAGFRGKPAREGVEFLATPDDWCRPVSLAHGPDGALYVVDMCRAVIEHPQFMPAELKDRRDLLLGKERGRIWRIVPEGMKERPRPPHLSKATTAELVALLGHADAWWRTTAQRLLLERQDQAAVPLLQKLVRQSDQALARVHAAWLLNGVNGLDAELILGLLDDVNPRAREQGVVLAEGALARNAALQERLTALASDPDARLRYQVALSLGEWDDDRILVPLARVALAGVDDHWTRQAVASSVCRRAGPLVATLVRQGLTDERSAGRFILLNELSALVGGRQDADEVAGLLETLATLPGSDGDRWRLAGLDGLTEGMGRRGTQFNVFLATRPSSRKAVVERATQLLTRAALVAADDKREPADRVSAIALLAHAPWDAAGPVLTNLVVDDSALDVRLAAVRALAAHPRPEVTAVLMKAWRTYPHAVRREVAEAMLRQPDRALAFLGEVEAGRVQPGDLDPQRSRQLVNHPRLDVRDRARKLLQDCLPADRKEVLRTYQAALKVKGDARRGRTIFEKNCATCHRFGGAGHEVGPDISDAALKAPDALLVDILDPNAAIDSNYVSYAVTTKSGRLLTGLLSSETPSSVTLKRAEGQTEVVLRQDIEAITSSGTSLMPEGLEKTVAVPDMADLLAFLRNWRFLEAGGAAQSEGKRPGQ
jgi:putative membrane-bound dehydrogenase-like protein